MKDLGKGQNGLSLHVAHARRPPFSARMILERFRGCVWRPPTLTQIPFDYFMKTKRVEELIETSIPML
jgi:hypothetical protein